MYSDDHIQLSRYRNFVEALCANELGRIRNMGYVRTIEEPYFAEESLGVHVSLHDIFSDRSSSALYDVTYIFFVTYYGRLELRTLQIVPYSDSESDLPWEGCDK